MTISMPGQVYLRGEPVDLHIVEEEDIDYLQNLINHPDIWPTLFQARPSIIADKHSFYETNISNNDSRFDLIICVNEEPVGTVSLLEINPDWGTAEIGFYIEPTSQNCGYASEAIALLLEYAFEQRRLEKIYANTFATNSASQRVLIKNGFVEEGKFREQGFIDGERVDIFRYGILSREHYENDGHSNKL